MAADCRDRRDVCSQKEVASPRGYLNTGHLLCALIPHQKELVKRGLIVVGPRWRVEGIKLRVIALAPAEPPGSPMARAPRRCSSECHGRTHHPTVCPWRCSASIKRPALLGLAQVLDTGRRGHARCCRCSPMPGKAYRRCSVAGAYWAPWSR